MWPSVTGWKVLAVARDHDANKPDALATFGSVGARSINVGSSSLVRELLTRFDTGHLCSTSFAAGLSNSTPAPAREPQLELIRFKYHRHSIVDLANEVMPFSSHATVSLSMTISGAVIPECRPDKRQRAAGGRLGGYQAARLGEGARHHQRLAYSRLPPRRRRSALRL
jgi:hypothetical protein